MTHTATPIAVLLAALLLPATASAQDKDPAKLFPLDVGRAWTYVLRVKVGTAEKKIDYTTKITGLQELEGTGSCVVFESRSGQRLLQTDWYLSSETKVTNPKRKQGRGPTGTYPARTLLDFAGIVKFDAGDKTQSWTWTCSDGSKGTVVPVRREKINLKNYKNLACLVLVDEGTHGEGAQLRKQKREIWLAPGIGMVKEETTVTKENGDVVLKSWAELLRYQTP